MITGNTFKVLRRVEQASRRIVIQIGTFDLQQPMIATKVTNMMMNRINNRNRYRSVAVRSLSMLPFLAMIGILQGCQIFGIASVIGQNIEREKKVEVLAEYDGLRNQTVAVVVQTDMSTLYQFPKLVAEIGVNMSRRLAQNVEGIQVLDPRFVLDWTYHKPGWETMPYGEVCEELGVERLVWIDMFEFRLNPPGNRWQWEGVAGASIGIVELDGFDSDAFAETYDVSGEFPKIAELGRESSTEARIEMGLLATFIEQAAWLFFDHIEDKYPDA